MERLRAVYAAVFAAAVAVAAPALALAQGSGPGSGNPPAESVTKRGGMEWFWPLLAVALAALAWYVFSSRRRSAGHRR
jgi:hypothetical protein